MPGKDKKKEQEDKNNFSVEDQTLLIVFMKQIMSYVKTEGINKEYLNLIKANVYDAEQNRFFVNSLFNQKRVNKFSNSTHLLMSALIPKIRIYKVVEIPDNVELKNSGLLIGKNQKNPQRKSYSFLFPFEEGLNTVSYDKVKKEQRTYFKDLVDLSKEYGKAYGTGIINATVNDGSAIPDTSNITLNVQVLVSTFDILFKDFIVQSEEDPEVYCKVNFINLLQRERRADTSTGTTVDLIDDVFRLKIIVGWNYDIKTLKRINFGSNTFTQSDINDIKASLEKVSSTYYCALHKFDLNVSENGSIKLDLAYIGANNGVFGSKDASVIYIKDENGKAVTPDKYIKDLITRKQLEQDFIKASGNIKLSEEEKSKNKKAEEQLVKAKEAKLEEMQKAMSYDRYMIHRQFFTSLMEDAKIYSLEVPEQIVNKLRDAVKEKDQEIKDYKTASLYTANIGDNKVKILPLDPVAQEKVKQDTKKISESSKDFNQKKIEEREKDLSVFRTITKSQLQKHRSVNFIFLGDILDYAFGALNVKDKEEFGRIIPIVGNFCTAEPEPPVNIVVEQPKSAKKQKNQKTGPIKYEKIEMGPPVAYNYCDLPISVERFKKFLFDKIVASKVEQLRLEVFLTSLFNDLINNAFDANIFGAQLKRVFGNAMFGQSTLRTYTENGVQKEFFSGRPFEEAKNRDVKNTSDWGGSRGFTEIDVLPDMDPPLYNQEKNGENELVNYYYIYSKIQDQMSGKVLTYEERDAFGIIEINLGADIGPVKKINFSKANIPGLAESAFKEERSHSRANPLLLQGVMNIDIEMFGNPFFKAGSQIYLNPSFMLRSPGTISEKVREFGLGGYYQVTKLTHEISSGKFLTKATAVFNHFGDGKPTKFEPNPEPITSSLDGILSTYAIWDSLTADETREVDEEMKKEAEQAKKGNTSKSSSKGSKGNARGKK